MSSAKFSIGVAAVMAATVASGLIHGRLRDRWGPDKSTLAAGDVLSQFPTTAIGAWQVLDESELEENAVNMLECTGYISRAYLNTETGDVVQMFVVHGPQGPISVHTPEVCYSTREYNLPKSKSRLSLNLDGRTHEVWNLELVSRAPIDQHLLQVCYGWTASAAEPWQAPESARLGFLGQPSLFKIQIACQLPLEHSLESRNPCKSFLADFLPALNAFLETAE